MKIDRLAKWLGVQTGPLAAGVHLTAEYLTLAAVRPRPLTLVAIGREVVFDAALTGDEDRRIDSVADELRALAHRLRLPAETPTVAALDPAVDELSMIDGRPPVVTIRPGRGTAGFFQPEPELLDRRALSRISTIIEKTDLELERVDLVPIALARVARTAGRPMAAIRGPGRWTVTTGDGYTRAERLANAATLTLAPGPDLPTIQSIDDLDGLTVPTEFRPYLDLNRDGPAIGAALLTVGCQPLHDAAKATGSTRSKAARRSRRTAPPCPTTGLSDLQGPDPLLRAAGGT